MTCLNGNYLDLYTSSALYASRWDSLARYGLLIGTGLSFTSGNKYLQAVSLIALSIASLIGLATGVRSDFLALVLLVTWLAHKKFRRYSLIAVVAVPVFMIATAQVTNMFSCRAPTATNQQAVSNPMNAVAQSLTGKSILAFIHGQGTSLLSIHVAGTVTPYPWPGYFQTFVPGFGIAAKLAGRDFSLPDLYFAQHMAKTWMPERYANGEGFGWSIVSDMIVFGQGSPMIAVALSAATGFGFAALVSAAATSALWFGCLVVLLPKIVLLPRAGLYSIVPYAATFLLIFAMWRVFFTARPRLLSPSGIWSS
jgi:hypothetical protein